MNKCWFIYLGAENQSERCNKKLSFHCSISLYRVTADQGETCHSNWLLMYWYHSEAIFLGCPHWASQRSALSVSPKLLAALQQCHYTLFCLNAQWGLCNFETFEARCMLGSNKNIISSVNWLDVLRWWNLQGALSITSRPWRQRFQLLNINILWGLWGQIGVSRTLRNTKKAYNIYSGKGKKKKNLLCFDFWS